MLYKKCLLLILLAWSNQLFPQQIRLGIVSDFPQSPVIDSVLQVMTMDIDRTTGSAKKVTLAPEHIIYESNSLEQARANYDLIAPRVDFVILIGGVSIKGAVINGPFPKPTIGLGIIDPDLQEIPFQDGKSGVQNFSYIWAAQDFEKELTQFKQLFPFENLSILTDSAAVITFNQQKARQAIDSLNELFSTAINIVPVTGDISTSLSAMPDETDAVYLTELYGKTSSDIRQIANELNARKLPSFSSNKWHVDNGILACVSDENDFEQTIRKLAIMVDESTSGGPLEEMPVVINYKDEFFLNMQAAREIDFSPPFEILFTANLIGDIEGRPATYSLEEIMQRALENNFDVKITYQDIALAEQDMRRARTTVRPSLDLSFSGSQINSERANALIDSPERLISGQLTLNQLLYSEQAIAGIKIAQYIRKAQEYDTEANVLSVLLDTYIEYFNVLSAKTNLLIQQENLNNSKTNLELAKIRLSVGSSSIADVYRWESEVAVAKQVVVEAQTAVIGAKLRLNTFLANSLEDEYDINDVTIDDETYQKFSDDRIAKVIRTPKDLELVTDFLVQEAVNANPNKMFLLENIKATEREWLQNKRLLYVPQLAFQAQTSQVLDRGGRGSEEVPGGNQFFDNSWQLGLTLSYPLFQGNARRIDIQRSTIQLEQLEHSRELLDQNLELSVRTSVLQLLNSYTNIAFSKTASDNALRNFELVQENYKQGVVIITQLVEAQQAALQARLSYALSIYEYVQAQLQLEFSIGFFSMFTTPDKVSEFEDRFLQFKSDN